MGQADVLGLGFLDELGDLREGTPDYLRQMAVFAVNTGCRSGEIYQLRWEWETLVPELGTSVLDPVAVREER